MLVRYTGADHAVADMPQSPQTHKGHRMKVIICSQQRTGSNMLRTMLAQQSGIRVGGEACNDTCSAWWSTWTESPMPLTLKAHIIDNHVADHIAEVWKVFDIWNLHDRFHWGLKNIPEVGMRYHQALLKDPTFKVIWLEREDKIAQAMSLMIARMTQHWVKYLHQNNTTTTRFTLDKTHAKQLARAFIQQRQQIQRLFAPHNFPSMWVTYEELRDDSQATLRRVTDFLGVSYTACEPKTKVTFTTPLKQLVTNYDEIVVEYINGT